MGDMAEDFKALRESKKLEKEDHRNRSCAVMTQAIVLASQNRMRLRMVAPDCFQLRHDELGWIINLYPTTQRVYNDKTHRGPFLKLPEDWTLLDAVKAAIT